MSNQISGVTREAGAFQAFRFTCYPTSADRDRGTNGRVRYALAEREARDRSAPHAAPPLEEVEVTLMAGCFRVTTPEGCVGILSAARIIGLDLAIQEGGAVVRNMNLPGTHTAELDAHGPAEG